MYKVSICFMAIVLVAFNAFALGEQPEYHSDLNPVIYYYGRDSQTYELKPMRMGFCDKEGNEVIPPLFDQAGSFINSVAIVMKDNKFGVINTLGELILPFEYDEIMEYGSYLKIFKSEDYYKRRLAIPELGPITSGGFDSPAITRYARLEGIVDRSGRIIIPCEYNNVDYFTRSYRNISLDYTEDEAVQFSVRKEVSDEIHLRGLMDSVGNEIFPVKYADIDDGGFGRYILWSSPQERAGMADKNRNIIIPMEYDNIYPTMDPEYIIIIQNGKSGMITPQNRVLIPPNKFDGIALESTFGKIFFFVVVEEKWGRVDRSGKILLAPKYDSIYPYQGKDDDSMVVEISGQCIRIDSKGNIIERYEEHPYII